MSWVQRRVYLVVYAVQAPFVLFVLTPAPRMISVPLINTEQLSESHPPTLIPAQDVEGVQRQATREGQRIARQRRGGAQRKYAWDVEASHFTITATVII